MLNHKHRPNLPRVPPIPEGGVHIRPPLQKPHTGRVWRRQTPAAKSMHVKRSSLQIERQNQL